MSNYPASPLAYLDNAATTKPCPEAVDAATRCLTSCYGNPSSLHSVGLGAELEVTAARKRIAAMLGAEQAEIIFTSGATESNNAALFGAARMTRRGGRIVTTSVEHPSVAAATAELATQGFEVVRIRPRDGEIAAEDLIAAVDTQTVLVSAMLVCNENGAILPVARAFGEIKRRFPNALTHCDAVQAFCKLEVNAPALHADLISLSAHKLHGMKGAGALYVKKRTRLAPMLLGGGQERGMRSGTEPVPAIAAFGAAVAAASPKADTERVRAISDYAKERLAALDFIAPNFPASGSPYILSFSVCGIRSEILLHFLESRGVFVSSGSACSKGAKSSVLKEFGASDKQLDSALRISLSRFSTKEEIDLLINGLIEGERTLQR